MIAALTLISLWFLLWAPFWWCCCGEDEGGVPAPGCPCNGGASGVTPAILYMHVTHPELNAENYRNAVLVWGPTPTAYNGLLIGPYNHYSVETYQDWISGESFRYLLRCEIGLYVLRKCYAVSVFGTPYMSAVLYSWAIGFPGNQCHHSPTVLMTLYGGQIQQAGDPTTVVRIDEIPFAPPPPPLQAPPVGGGEGNAWLGEPWGMFSQGTSQFGPIFTTTGYGTGE